MRFLRFNWFGKRCFEDRSRPKFASLYKHQTSNPIFEAISQYYGKNELQYRPPLIRHKTLWTLWELLHYTVLHSSHKKGHCHPFERTSKSSKESSQSDWPAWKNISHGHKKGQGKSSYYTSWPTKGQSSYKLQLLYGSSVCYTTDREQTDISTLPDFKPKLTSWRSCTVCCQAATKKKI